MRFFNAEGPNRPDDHDTLPPLGRWDLAGVMGLIEQKKYFLLHAPRQTGRIWRDGGPDPLPEGAVQLDAYLAGLDLR